MPYDDLKDVLAQYLNPTEETSEEVPQVAPQTDNKTVSDVGDAFDELFNANNG